MSDLYIVDTLGDSGTGRLTFDTAAKAKAVADEIDRTTSVLVVVWRLGMEAGALTLAAADQS